MGSDVSTFDYLMLEDRIDFIQRTKNREVFIFDKKVINLTSNLEKNKLKINKILSKYKEVEDYLGDNFDKCDYNFLNMIIEDDSRRYELMTKLKKSKISVNRFLRDKIKIEKLQKKSIEIKFELDKLELSRKNLLSIVNRRIKQLEQINNNSTYCFPERKLKVF